MSDLVTCFEQFQHSAFRLEALPAYAVTGEGGLRSVRTNRYLAWVATAALAGKSWTRVRVLDDPLTAYQREQLDRVYIESNACGENVYVVDRGALRTVWEDFWLFDGGYPEAQAVLMRFDAEGRPAGDELVTAAGRLDDLRTVARELLNRSTSLTEYRAAVGG